MHQSNRVYVLDVMSLNENKQMKATNRLLGEFGLVIVHSLARLCLAKIPSWAYKVNRIVEEGAEDTDYMYL